MTHVCFSGIFCSNFQSTQWLYGGVDFSTFTYFNILFGLMALSLVNIYTASHGGLGGY